MNAKPLENRIYDIVSNLANEAIIDGRRYEHKIQKARCEIEEIIKKEREKDGNKNSKHTSG